ASVEQDETGSRIVDASDLELDARPDDEDPEREPDQAAPQFGIIQFELCFDVVAHLVAFSRCTRSDHRHPEGAKRSEALEGQRCPYSILRGPPPTRLSPD